jgi:hypothetical protein
VTAQIEDRVSFDGQEWGVRAEPLLPWLRAHLDVMAAFSAVGLCSPCWRGYVASWTVEDGKFWLSDIKSEAIASPESLRARLPLLAGWVSGKLTLLGGHRTSAAALITINAGNVTGDRRFAVRVHHSAGGLGIEGIPEFGGLAGDDSFWGVISAERRPWPGGDADATRSGWGPKKPLFDDSADRWGLASILTAGGVGSPAIERTPP